MQSAIANTVVFYREIAGWAAPQLLGIVDFNYVALSGRIWKRCHSRMASYSVFVHGLPVLNLGQQIREVVDVCSRRVRSRAWAYNTGRMLTNSNIWNLVVVISLFLPRPNISRLKAVFVMLILLIGFAIPTAPYVKVRGKVLPPKPRELIGAAVWESDGIGRNNFDDTAAVYTVSGMPANILKALGRLAREVSDNLMYFFVLPLAVGLYSHFRKLQKILLTERFFVFALVVLYVVMMVLLHTNYGYISRRHCMPIVVFAVFYIPVGLQIMARWLSEKTSKNSLTVHRDRRRWFFILMAIGLGTCAAKFVKITPLRWEKQGYLEAAKWLKENTSEKDLIAVPDPRIGFYAQRPSTRMRGEKIPGNTTYVVKFLDDKRAEENINFNREVRKRYSVWMNKKEEKRRIVIYEVL